MDWISARDALPIDDAMVLVVYRRPYRGGKTYIGRKRLTVTMARFGDDLEWHFLIGGYRESGRSENVTHWMPLPRPPTRPDAEQ